MQSQIQRITAGVLNRVNDEVIGGTPVGTGEAGWSATSGQLGQSLVVDHGQLLFDDTLGHLFPGEYQYVQLDPEQEVETPLAVGDLVFWVGEAGQFRVSTTSAEGDEAGYVVTPGWTPGHYAFIYKYGQANLYTPAPIEQEDEEPGPPE